MRTARTLGTPYPRAFFNGVRIFIFISTVIVVAIMIYFAIHLHGNGFKLPWPFLVILVSCFLTFLNLAFTSALFCYDRLVPVLSMTFNVILFLLWTVSLGLLSWSMSGTLKTTCDTSSWGTNVGVMVCRIYKVLFSFVVVAFACHFMAIVIDIIARRRQHSLGEYEGMYSDIKLDQRGSLLSGAPSNPNDPNTDAYNAFGTVRPQDQRYHPYNHKSQNSFSNTSYNNDVLEQHHAGEAREFYDNVPTVGGGWTRRGDEAAVPLYSPLRTNMDDLHQYRAHPGDTHYDPNYYR